MHVRNTCISKCDCRVRVTWFWQWAWWVALMLLHHVLGLATPVDMLPAFCADPHHVPYNVLFEVVALPRGGALELQWELLVLPLCWLGRSCRRLVSSVLAVC